MKREESTEREMKSAEALDAGRDEQGDASGHVPVLLDEVLEYLDPQPGQTVVDCTLGRGGHAYEIMKRIGPGGRYIGFDIDAGNLEYARERLSGVEGVGFEGYRCNFADAGRYLEGVKVDGLLADLGYSSTQVDDAERGLGFRTEGPLDMRLDDRIEETAGDLVGELDEEDLADLIYRYGEERLSRRIARNIVEIRRRQPITTTTQLAEICLRAYGPGGRRSRIHPATRTFQALRIAVNDELGSLERLIEHLPDWMNHEGGRGVIISFHSLEDRIVKHGYRELARDGGAKLLTRKPVMASEMEQGRNPRSRSAKLRAIRFHQALH